MELDIKIIPATDARRIVDSGQYEQAIRQLRHVVAEIDQAIAQGDTSICRDGYLPPPVVQKLQQAGYTVKNDSFRNEQMWTVSW